MSIDGFKFEGRDITARQLKREITAYGEGMLQSALENGMKTRADVIGYCERRLTVRRHQRPVGPYAGYKQSRRFA